MTKLVVIAGPTSSGKSALAVRLAKKFNGEIISADSRQVFKGMDIGTAKTVFGKPTRPHRLMAQRLAGSPAQIFLRKTWAGEARNKNAKLTRNIVRDIPHHLIDVVRPNQEFNVAIYKKLAIRAIKEIQGRGKLPFLVGGTGLYIQAVVDNAEFPRVPPQKKLRKVLEKKSTKELFNIYKKLDLQGAKFIEKENKRRLIRAIEVCKITKKPFWRQRKKGKPLFDALQLGTKLPEKKLKERIKKRVNKMIKMGLEKEVKNLVKKYSWNIPPLQTIGYQEWKEYSDGKIDREELKEKIKSGTWHYARRQMTWFKRDSRIHWIKNYKEAEKSIKTFLK